MGHSEGRRSGSSVSRAAVLAVPLTRPPTASSRSLDVTVTVERRGAATVLCVAGELDALTASSVREAVERALGDAPPVLVIDLTGVTFLASAGMVAIMADEESAARTSIRVVAAHRECLRPLRLTGLDEVMKIFPTIDDALVS